MWQEDFVLDCSNSCHLCCHWTSVCSNNNNNNNLHVSSPCRVGKTLRTSRITSTTPFPSTSLGLYFPDPDRFIRQQTSSVKLTTVLYGPRFAHVDSHEPLMFVEISIVHHSLEGRIVSVLTMLVDTIFTPMTNARIASFSSSLDATLPSPSLRLLCAVFKHRSLL